MKKNPERIIREVLAALISSKLSTADLRLLAELLMEDRSFSRDLADMLRELSFKIGSQERFEWAEPSDSKQSYGGLTDLAYSIIQRKRYSKEKLFGVLEKIGGGDISRVLSRSTPMREIINYFLETAPSAQLDEFMNYLGVEVGHDAYLGGIGRREK
ncbi:hypothetical protein LL967_12305 [Xanthomonas campestris pv. zinniae]|uniref:hypothetical protein n=1 Tax=Xanthomonas cannabis TaxID=1885674 RepID=UPI001E417DF9|nr:hypothetical protein [Xanthomonas campestris pv. zinniae]